jgi:hypothetical protein
MSGSSVRVCLLSSLVFLPVALGGCANSVGPLSTNPGSLAGGSSSGSSTAKVALGGKVFGGQQPIVGAAVTLWSAGTTGSYGSGATSIATTTTASDGTFSFNTAGVSPCTTGQYLYITAVGGNPGAGTNQYAALMAALPSPCSAATAGTFVNINEATTVASVTALQQFMSISPGNTPAWSIGTPAANVTGMANAFLQVGNLINIATGASGATTTASTLNSVTYTTTITPDTSKIYALADILAACVNTAGNGTCTSLMNDAKPTSATAPVDTIQAAYYLATDAGGVNLPAHGATQGEPYYLCNAYITGTSPFQPSTACTTTSYPTDWAIGVTWATSNGTSTVGTANTYSLAIDGGGDVWTAHSVVSGSDTNAANITEFNPSGQVQFAPVTSATITTGPTTQYSGGSAVSYTSTSTGNFTGTLTGSTSPTVNVLGGRGNDLAIDTNNNAWFAAYNTSAPATSGALQGLLTEVSPTGSTTGILVPALVPGVLTIDGGNNIYFDDEPVSGRYYTSELEFSNATHTGPYAVFDEGIDRQTATEEVVWADSSGYVWSVASGGKCTPPGATIYRGNTAELEADGALGVSADDVTGSSGCPLWGGTSDGSGGAYFTQNSTYGTAGLYHMAISGNGASKTAPAVVSIAAGTGTTNGGLDGATGVFVDGLGNVWVANSAGGVSEFSFATGAFVALSPSGTTTLPVYGFGTSYLSGKNPYYVAADGSGNLWVGSADTALHYLVGIAAPTVTPTSLMLKNNFVGSRPGALTLASLSPALSYSTVAGVGSQMTSTLTNTGPASLNIGQIFIGGANPSAYSVSSTTCGSTLASGANCSITVSFLSPVAGTFNATLDVASNAVGSPAVVSLTGSASAAAGTLSLQPGTPPPAGPALNFGTVTAPSSSTPQAVVITNTGSSTMPLTLGTTGSGANIFPETTSCGSSLAAGASCFVSFEFSPKVAGSYSAALTVNNGAGTSQGASLSGNATPFTITVNSSNPIAWVIDNGAITFNWNSVSGDLNSWVLDGHSDQLVDTTTLGNFTYNGTTMSQPEGLYSGMVGPFMNGTPTASCTAVGVTVVGTPTTTCTAGSGTTPYLDWAITWPDTANSANAYTFVWHNVVFPNDPGVHTYVQLIHNANDIAGSVGQIQWIFRDNQSIFTNTYEVNSSLGWLGVEDIPLPSVADMASSDPGRVVQNATEDLHGFTDIPAGFGREFMTKYDYAGYEYLHQAHGLYGAASSGTTYGVWTVLPKLETLVGGPTKQNLWFTENIDMIEAYSNHEDNNLSLATPAGTASNRLFGPYYIHVNTLGQANNQTGNTLASQADMYADAISAENALVNQYDTVDPLVAAGYTPSTGRGTVSIQMNGVTGQPHTAWAVLSDPNTNIQYSSQGMQYWADISGSGAATFTGVVPGTYRLSVYVLGQWGEYRQDGITVTANSPTTVPAAAFVPENFSTTNGETVFTIGTPDRSSHEFLHGHNTTTGHDDREYWGAWNYWQDFAANQGAVVYYATAVGSTPATNDLSKWNYTHWGQFNPGLFAGVFNSQDDTTDGYQAYPGQEYPGIAGVGAEYAIPSYVASITGASGTNGATTGIPPWQVYFATPADIASYSSGYAQLSISSACAYGSYVVTINGHQLIWHYANYSDCMIRSGLSGYTQWFVMEFPASYLNQTPGGSNEITVSMSQVDGAQDDAWRLELTNNTSNPATTGWNDYTYISGTTTTLNNDTVPNP